MHPGPQRAGIFLRGEYYAKKEELQINEEMLYIYSGILFHNQKFQEGNQEKIQYVLDCPEFAQLREKYALVEIAGKGGDFGRAKRLMHYLAPRLTHSSWYDNHVPCNALALLEYSQDAPEHGINCLNKAKILEECCLALGICARRVFIMPFSPYDFDNHVVTEIYDRKRQKWIVLDPTTDGYFVDEHKQPLSLLEMRERFANDRFVTFVHPGDSLKDLRKLRDKYMDENAYICKNLFYFGTDQRCCFGEAEQTLWFCPDNFSIKSRKTRMVQFQIEHMPEEHKENVPVLKEALQKIQNSGEQTITCIEQLQTAPIA